MPSYGDEMRGLQNILESDSPNVFDSGNQSIRGADDAMREAVKQALIRRAQENIQRMQGEWMSRSNMPGLSNLLTRTQSDPRVAGYLQQQGVVRPEELTRERGIMERLQRLQSGPGVAGTIEPLGTSGLRVEPSDLDNPQGQTNQGALSQIQDPGMRQRLIEILGGQKPGMMNDAWSRIKNLGAYR